MGSLEEAKGNLKQAAGDLLGDPDLEREGKAQEEKGESEREASEARAEAKAREADAARLEAEQRIAQQTQD